MLQLASLERADLKSSLSDIAIGTVRCCSPKQVTKGSNNSLSKPRSGTSLPTYLSSIRTLRSPKILDGYTMNAWLSKGWSVTRLRD